MTGKMIGEGELAQLAEGGHYLNVAATLLGTHTLKTTGRTVVTAEDVAIFLACLKFFTGRMNADGTLPVRRFEGLWSALYEAGDVGRAFDCHRFKAIRDYLSGLGLLDWEDRTFVAPTKDHDGNRFRRAGLQVEGERDAHGDAGMAEISGRSRDDAGHGHSRGGGGRGGSILGRNKDLPRPSPGFREARRGHPIAHPSPGRRGDQAGRGREHGETTPIVHARGCDEAGDGLRGVDGTTRRMICLFQAAVPCRQYSCPRTRCRTSPRPRSRCRHVQVHEPDAGHVKSTRNFVSPTFKSPIEVEAPSRRRRNLDTSGR